MESFLSFCRSVEGQELPTIGGQGKFLVHLAPGGVEYTLLSNNKHRRQSQANIETVLDRFDKTGSFITTGYLDLTGCVSYILRLIKRYVKSGGG